MQPTRLTTWLLSGLCALSAGGCTSDQAEPTPTPAPEKPKVVRITYDATQCADPWGFTSTQQQLATTAATYLVQHGVSSYRHLTVTPSSPSPCAACTCKRGVLLTGSVTETELPAAVALGFKK